MKKTAILLVLAMMLSLLLSCNSGEPKETQTQSTTVSTTVTTGVQGPDKPDEDTDGDENAPDDDKNQGDTSTDGEGNTDTDTDNDNGQSGNTSTDDGKEDNADGDTDIGENGGEDAEGENGGASDDVEKSDMTVALEMLISSFVQLLSQDTEINSSTNYSVGGISAMGTTNNTHILFSAENFEFIAENSSVSLGEQQSASNMVYKDGYLYVSTEKDGVPVYNKVKVSAEDVLNLLLTGGMGGMLPGDEQSQPEAVLLSAEYSAGSETEPGASAEGDTGTDAEQNTITLDELFKEITFTENEKGETVIVFSGVDSSAINSALASLLESVSEEDLSQSLEGADASLVQVFDTFIDAVKNDKVKYDVTATVVIGADGNFVSSDSSMKALTTQTIFGISFDVTLFEMTNATSADPCEEKVVVELPENADEYVETTLEEALGSIGGTTAP